MQKWQKTMTELIKHKHDLYGTDPEIGNYHIHHPSEEYTAGQT